MDRYSLLMRSGFLLAECREKEAACQELPEHIVNAARLLRRHPVGTGGSIFLPIGGGHAVSETFRRGIRSSSAVHP
jgi:hypothetical protein